RRWTLDSHQSCSPVGQTKPTKSLLKADMVGSGGVEPPSSSVSANGGEALCGSPFPQVAANRTCRSYAFSWRLIFSPSRSDDIRGRIRGSDDAGARLGTG